MNGFPKRQCTRCRSWKDATAFQQDRRRKGGSTNQCKECWNAYMRTYRVQHPEQYRLIKENSRLRTLYGISLRGKQEMYIAQKGCCALCGKSLNEWKKANVDHDHETGKVRSLLCARCNSGLAVLENTLYLMQAVRYLRTHGKDIRLEDA